MLDKDIKTQEPYTKGELAEIGINPLCIDYAGYQLFGRGEERFILDPKKNGEDRFVLKSASHRYKMGD